MSIASGINSLLKGVQTPNPVNVYDVYSPAKQQQFIINQQNIAANQQRAQQNQAKLEQQQLDLQRRQGLEEDLTDLADTYQYIKAPDMNEEELNRSVYQNQLNIAEAYKQNGYPEKALDILNGAIKLRLDQQDEAQKEERQALTDLIQAGHTRNQGIVDFTQKLHSDVYDKFGVGQVNVSTPASGRGGKEERTLTSPDGIEYSERDISSFQKSVIKRAEKKEAGDGISQNKYVVPAEAYDPKKFAALVKEFGTSGAMQQILNPPGNNPVQEPGQAAGRNVVVVRKKQ